MKNDVNLTKGLSCMSVEYMEKINGGSAGDAVCAGGGTVLIAWAPAAAFIPVVGPAVAAGMVLKGAAGIVIGTNSDVDLIKY